MRGGPVPPTGKSVAADYVYAMEFDGDLIRHLTKIWNDGTVLSKRDGLDHYGRTAAEQRSLSR